MEGGIEIRSYIPKPKQSWLCVHELQIVEKPRNQRLFEWFRLLLIEVAREGALSGGETICAHKQIGNHQ